MRNAGLEEAQAGIKIARRNINNLRYADDTTLMAGSEGELKGLFFFLICEFYLFIYFCFTLQYCIGFAIHQHESTMGVHVFPILKPLPPPSPYHPCGSSQCTSPEHPISCIEPRLAIHVMYDYTCFIAILPNHPTLSLSHRVQKTVLYICVFFAILHTGLSLPSF